MTEIKFNNIKELEEYLNYLDTVEIGYTLKQVYNNTDNMKELFVYDILQDENRDLAEALFFSDNTVISKALWGTWVEDGKKILDDMYDYDIDYDKLVKYTQCFEEFCSTNWKEKETEKEKINLLYDEKINELEEQIKVLEEKIKENKKQQQKEIKKINEKYSKI